MPVKNTDYEPINKIQRYCDYPNATLEKNGGKRITRSSGYVPINKQIEMLEDAGKAMEDFREGSYDYQDEDVIQFTIDPTRAPNFDHADASEYKRKAEDYIKQQEIKANFKRRNLERAKRASEYASKVSMGDNINKDNIAQSNTIIEGGKNVRN